jgi:hypothetical protein
MRENLTDEIRSAVRLLASGMPTETARVIDEDSWNLVADPASMAVERLSLAIDVAPDRSVASVSFAGKRPDGRWHVELDEQRKGVDWVPAHGSRPSRRRTVSTPLSWMR